MLTGTPNRRSRAPQKSKADANKQDVLLREISQGVAIRQMMETPGWKMFSEALEDKHQAAVDELRGCKSMDEVIRCQAQLDVLDLMLQMGANAVSRGKQAEDELHAMNQEDADNV